jgi:hypothetical protein
MEISDADRLQPSSVGLRIGLLACDEVSKLIAQAGPGVDLSAAVRLKPLFE